jgi:hypothetical protein
MSHVFYTCVVPHHGNCKGWRSDPFHGSHLRVLPSLPPRVVSRRGIATQPDHPNPLSSLSQSHPLLSRSSEVLPSPPLRSLVPPSGLPASQGFLIPTGRAEPVGSGTGLTVRFVRKPVETREIQISNQILVQLVATGIPTGTTDTGPVRPRTSRLNKKPN